MSSALVTLKDEIIQAIKDQADGTAPWNYDLSDDEDRVKEGDGGITMGLPPCVILGGFSIVPSYGGGATLGEYETAFGLEWWAYAPSDDEYPKARANAAIRLATDVIRAVHRAHQSATYPNLRACTRVLAACLQTFNDGQDVPPGCGLAYGTITIVTNTEDGA